MESKGRTHTFYSIARVVTVQTHAEFLNLSLYVKGENEDGLTEEDMYSCIVNYLNYANIDSDPAESWNLRRTARDSFKKLKVSTEDMVKKNARSGGLVGHFFAAAPAAKGSLREVGQKLTKDLLDKGYNIEKTATTLFTTAAGGIANIPSSVSPTKALFPFQPLKAKTHKSSSKSSTGSSKTRTPSTGPPCKNSPQKTLPPLLKPSKNTSLKPAASPPS